MYARDQARDYFKNQCGLSYSDVDILALQYLKSEIDDEFNHCRKEALENKDNGYWHRVNDAKRFKGQFDGYGKMICAFLTGKGAYFHAREVVSFNLDGRIGFCGAACDTNAQPVIRGFMRWCDWLKKQKEG